MLTKLVELKHNPSMVSDRYKFISTMDIINELGDLLDLDTAKVKTSKNGTKHIVDIALKLGNVQVANDICKPRLVIHNSYNGEGALKVRLGLYRLVCSNGLVIGTDYYSKRIMHIAGPKADESIKDLVASLNGDLVSGLASKVSELASKDVNLTQLEYILDELSLSIKEYRAAIHAYRHPRRAYDSGSNGWLVYNRVQEALVTPTWTSAERNLDLMDYFLKIA